MMTQLDEASDKIPEGLYLQFCDHLQNLHNKTGSFSRIGRGRHQTRMYTVEEAPQIPPNEHGYVDVQDYQEAIDRMYGIRNEPTGDLRVRVAVVAAARWVTISVTAPTSSKTYSTRHRGSTVTLTYQHLKPLEK
jgi:hypothetical protein